MVRVIPGIKKNMHAFDYNTQILGMLTYQIILMLISLELKIHTPS